MERTIIVNYGGGYADYRINIRRDEVVTIESHEYIGDDEEFYEWHLVAETFSTPVAAMNWVMMQLGWIAGA